MPNPLSRRESLPWKRLPLSAVSPIRFGRQTESLKKKTVFIFVGNDPSVRHLAPLLISASPGRVDGFLLRHTADSAGRPGHSATGLEGAMASRSCSTISSCGDPLRSCQRTATPLTRTISE